jgi:glycine reductase
VSERLPVLHYLNQFFGGLGGETRADAEPRLVAGAGGPGMLLERSPEGIEVVATLVAGDNYVAEQTDRAVDELLALIEQTLKDPELERPRMLLAGPAFAAGRYGLACGALCKAAQERLGIPAVTAMHPENPAVESYRRDVTIVATAPDVMGMNDAIEGMARVAVRLARGEEVQPERDGTISRGLRRNYFATAPGAERAVAMLLKRARGEPFVTEYRVPVFDRVPPAPAVADLSTARLALVTSGGIVPKGNPDRIAPASARSFGEYSLDGLDALSAETHETVHGGYDPTYANEDPNRVLPLDVMRELEREGRVGALHDRYYATVGNGTSVAMAREFGAEIALRLLNDGVQAVVLTST